MSTEEATGYLGIGVLILVIVLWSITYYNIVKKGKWGGKK